MLTQHQKLTISLCRWIWFRYYDLESEHSNQINQTGSWDWVAIPPIGRRNRLDNHTSIGISKQRWIKHNVKTHDVWNQVSPNNAVLFITQVEKQKRMLHSKMRSWRHFHWTTYCCTHSKNYVRVICGVSRINVLHQSGVNVLSRVGISYSRVGQHRRVQIPRIHETWQLIYFSVDELDCDHIEYSDSPVPESPARASRCDFHSGQTEYVNG